ncbi:MAG: hypothetical protein NBV60_01045 [Erythrobacter sp.]|nr:hypothetical protein [Erythrobacter sp.]
MKAALPVLACALMLSACVPSSNTPASAPAPVARPASTRPAPAPVVVQAPASDSWMDAALTSGGWSYTDYGQGQGKRALFADPAGEYLFSLTCVTQPNGPEILLTRVGRPAKRDVAMTIRTETAQRTLAAQLGTPSLIMFAVGASDPLLDAMALSKGHFAVETEGEAPLYLPSWAEVSRVIEDCR